MNIKTITISRGATINLGNFESLRLDVQMTGELTSDENEFDAQEKLETYVVDEMERELMDLDIPERIKLAHVAMLRRHK